MQRRNFLKTSLAAAGIGTMPNLFGAPENEKSPDASREFYELRLYHLKKGKQKLFDDFYRDAAIPAMNRAGIALVGVFAELTPADDPTMYVLLPYKSLEEFGGAIDRVRMDADYKKLGAEFLNAPAADPSYVRVESSLMAAFSGMPKLALPAGTAEKKARIFELRRYESHIKTANKKKIEMFNTAEIALFRKAGLRPVFFGETLIGTSLPNLTYMLTFDDMADHDKTWQVFIADPDWKKLSTTPGYRDAEIVSKITRLFLQPTAYSQI